jgi:hypothetical protein
MTTTPIPTVGRRDMTTLSSGALAGLLSMAALALTYVLFATGLALGAIATRRSR